MTQRRRLKKALIDEGRLYRRIPISKGWCRARVNASRGFSGATVARYKSTPFDWLASTPR